MIIVTKLDDEKIYINPESILSVESVGDTFITFVNKQQLRVKESPEELQKRFMTYKRMIFSKLTEVVHAER